MEDLHAIMQIIDNNSNSIPEGQYLELCNRMRKLYKLNGDYKTLFDYEESIINILNINTDDDGHTRYFENHYLDTSIDVDRMYLENQIEYLTREEESFRPLKRVSKTVRYFAIKQYCDMNNIRLERNTSECLKKFHEENGLTLGSGCRGFNLSLKRIYKTYMAVENNYRHRMRTLINKRIDQLHSKLEDLEEI